MVTDHEFVPSRTTRHSSTFCDVPHPSGEGTCDLSPEQHHPPTEAAYTPKVGDRVRVVVEGAVTSVSDESVYLDSTDGFGHYAWLPSVTSIEKLPDPLPTTPGSVVRLSSGSLRFLTHDGWMTARGELVPNADSGFPCTVLFDAGATP